MKYYSQARPYAKAAYLFARDADQIKAWLNFLQKMASFLNDTILQSAIKHPHFNAHAFINLVLQKLDRASLSHFKNFLMLLAEKKRLLLLPEIYELFLKDVKHATACREVVLTTAMPLSQEDIKRIEVKLTAQFQQGIEMKIVENPALIGGFIVQSGDYVMDGSLTGQLQRLKQNLIF